MIKIESAELKRPIQTLSENDNCGDATLIIDEPSLLFLAVFDGSGHGYAAYEAANIAIKFLRKNYNIELLELIQALHLELKGSVGGVCGLCRINKESSQITCTGIGNITINLFNTTSKSFIIRGGVLGDEIVTPVLEQAILAPKDILMMYSDGIDNRLSPKDYPNFFNLSASDIARITLDYFSKPLDDAAVLVAKVQND